MSRFASLFTEERADTAAEFALVLPLLLIFLLGMIDVGRFMWEYNEAEKATQMGVRYAVVTDPVLSQISTYSFAETGEVTAGSTVPTPYFSSATCTSSICSCVSTTGGFCSTVTYNSTAFNNIVTRMSEMYPPIGSSNVEIIYKNVGLGFSGDPNGPDVSPLVTIKLQGLKFRPLTTLLFGASISMPDFSASLTGEDLSGTTGD